MNFWAEAFEAEEPELRQYRPFTSVDLDLLRPGTVVRRLLRDQALSMERERDPFGKPFMIVSHTFLIQNREGRVLPVDSLKMVAGLRPNEVKKGTVIVDYGGVRIGILSPISCLKAKLYNLRTIDQRGRQDEKHVRILIPCVRGFIRRLLTEGRNTGNCRPCLNALEQLLLYTSQSNFSNTARSHGISLNQAIPMDGLRGHPHPKINAFLSKRLPKWQQMIRRTSAS